jgi:hypothetical protein
LSAPALDQAGLDQSVEHRLKANGAQVRFEQSLAEVDERRGVKDLVA